MGLTCRHGHTRRRTIFIFDIDHLMIDNVVPTLVHASTIWAGFEGLCDVFNIQHIRIQDMLCPLHVSQNLHEDVHAVNPRLG